MNPDRLILLRALLFTSIAAFLLLAPSYRVITGERHPAFKAWMMYGSVGASLCRVEYFSADAEGTLHPIDRLAVLGHGDKPWWRVSKRVRRLNSVKAVDDQGRQLCRALGPGADVRVKAWCGSRTVWKRRRNVKENACERPRTKPRNSR